MTKEYGPHKYEEDVTSDCEYKCGCWMGPYKSGGPLGLDPFGICPGNPKDGKLLGGKEDYNFVVKQRIKELESRLYHAEASLEKVKPSKIKLADELVSAKEELAKKK